MPCRTSPTPSLTYVASIYLATTLMVGCSVPVAGGLDERDANLVADALNRSGIDANKEVDPTSEGRYQVVVPRGETAQAIATLRDHDLPPRHAPGVIDAIGKGSLVPSPLAEQAQYVAGIAGDIERSLASVDGILGTRVHLSVPPVDALSGQPARKPSAAVLIRHRGTAPPITEDQVRLLVAGAVAGLDAQDVSVVAITRPDAPALPVRELVQVGPISVTRASASWLRGLLGGAVALMALLAGALLFLWTRLNRLVSSQPGSGERA